ncbi:MAG TPA: Fe-S protein assembly chaperone HscA [Planctomycetota bacterium]|nr:Fe-S protein assembly chaperone HscA [Planctomycetota bacterium]
MGFIELTVLNNAARQLAIGIDLGTTNSLGALWKDGHPIVLHPEGENGYVPSALHFTEDGRVIVGREARDRALLDPEHTLFSIKRFMGRGLADVAQDAANVPCPITETANGVIEFEMRGRKYTPQELSALILMKVHDMACRALGGLETSRVVITVPAYFDDAQRQATRDAARLAGLEVLRIVNEPTAASLAYGLDQKKQGTVAVFDLGGGTFDVSLLSIDEGVFRVLATHGDTHLGGDDIDRLIVQRAMEDLTQTLSAASLREPGFQQLLRLAAEKCKIELSTNPEAELHVSLPDTALPWRRRFTREEFDLLAGPLVERTIDACRKALADAKLTPASIDEVVLVGGATRIPLVRRRVEEFFGRKPHTELNPDEVVALGAAVQAHVLTGGTRDILLMDVTPLSLGIETLGGAVAKLILRNSTIPCSANEGFTTYADNQTAIDFHVVQGERELARDCRTLGRFKLRGIPPMPAGMARVAVKFHIDANGMLTVSAKEESTGATARIEVTPMNGLTDAEVEGMLKASYDNARADFDASRLTNLRVEIGSMLRGAERGLREHGTALDKETVLDLEDSMNAVRKAMDQDDVHALQKARDVFERAAMPLAAAMMDSVAKTALTGKRLDEV